eukprot:4592144-Karenia_brevis.AAC.1
MLCAELHRTGGLALAGPTTEPCDWGSPFVSYGIPSLQWHVTGRMTLRRPGALMSLRGLAA